MAPAARTPRWSERGPTEGCRRSRHSRFFSPLLARASASRTPCRAAPRSAPRDPRLRPTRVAGSSSNLATAARPLPETSTRSLHGHFRPRALRCARPDARSFCPGDRFRIAGLRLLLVSRAGIEAPRYPSNAISRCAYRQPAAGSPYQQLHGRRSPYRWLGRCG